MYFQPKLDVASRIFDHKTFYCGGVATTTFLQAFPAVAIHGIVQLLMACRKIEKIYCATPMS